MNWGAGETVQRLGAFIALAEDPGSVLSDHKVVHSRHNSSSRNWVPYSDLSGHEVHIHAVKTLMHVQLKIERNKQK